jgi:hypothetical protein
VARALAGFGALVFVVAVPLPFAAGPFDQRCAEAAEGSSVALVVDFGDVEGQGAPPGGVAARCVPATDRMTGAQVLIDAGYSIRPGPGGMVCAINGYPSEGCGERIGERQYLYWSYWRADAGNTEWTYSSIGATGARVGDGDVEGWRFVDGTGRPSDPQPRRAADHVGICGPRQLPQAPAVVTPPASARQDPTGAAPASGAPVTDPGQLVAPDAPTEQGAPPIESTTPTGAATAGDLSSSDLALDAVTPASSTSGRGGAIGALLVVALIAVLATVALVRSRRRPPPG